jgi:hypothetical protein
MANSTVAHASTVGDGGHAAASADRMVGLRPFARQTRLPELRPSFDRTASELTGGLPKGRGALRWD